MLLPPAYRCLTQVLTVVWCLLLLQSTNAFQQCRAPNRSTSNASSSSSLFAVRFSSPLLESGYPPAVIEAEACHVIGISNPKPLLLYLPGFDGTLVAPFLQFPELGTIFEIRGMELPMDDRSTFAQLVDTIIEHLSKEQSDRLIYVMGESFGGLLTLEVALELQERKLKGLPICHLSGIVLVNPATCYLRSNLANLGPGVAELPEWRYLFGVLSLLPLFVDEYGLPQLLMMLKSEALPSVIDTEAREAYMGRTAFSLPQKLKFMPRATLRWRLNEWLTKGNNRLTEREVEMKDLLETLPVLILAGEKDKTLPAVDEANRLQGLLPDCSVHIVDGAGHAGTCGSRVDIAALMRQHFSALRTTNDEEWPNGFETAEENHGRTSMKEEAKTGEGKNFGMTRRYDGAVGVGLSPLLYWNKDLFRKWNGGQ